MFKMTTALISTSNLSKLEDIKKDIRSLLISMSNQDVTLAKLDHSYKNIMDESIPFKDFHYTSLKEFLISMPDVLKLKYNKNNQLCAYHIDTDKSRHISSLVKKEKSQKSNSKFKSRSIHYNLIDPYILNEVFQNLIKKSLNKGSNNKISSNINKIKINKQDVLCEITNYIGKHTFYTIENLNSQLNELSHKLSHDDNYIYFKNYLSKNKIENQKNFKNVFKKFNGKEINQMTNIQKNSVSDLIKEPTKYRLQKLINKYLEGIWCSELPKVYQREYGLDLEYYDLGFNSVIEFVTALPDIFQIIKPLNAKKHIVLNAKQSLECLQKSETLISKNSLENVENLSEPVPDKLSFKISKTLIPTDVMNIDETVDQIKVNSLNCNSEASIDVIISDVYNPSFFWITLHKNKNKFNKLMMQLREFYMQQDLDKYKIPQILLQPGLNVACIFAESWHRGIIKKIKSNSAIIHFYDFGTVSSYKINQLYFLDKRFSTIPAQAIPCGLHCIKPIEKNEWPKEVCKIFAERVLEKNFIATICSIDEENNSMMINLKDAKNIKIYINQLMVIKKIAKQGELIYKKSNFAFKHYQQCISGNFDTSNIECKKKTVDVKGKLTSTSEFINNSTLNYVSSEKKLEALNKYKEKFSNLPQSSLVIGPSDNVKDIKLHKNTFQVSEKLLDKRKPKISDNDKNKKCMSDDEQLNQSCSNSYGNCSSTDLSISSHSSSYINSLKISSTQQNFSEIMFKNCDTKIINSNDIKRKNKNLNVKIFREDINNTLKELQNLIVSTKL